MKNKLSIYLVKEEFTKENEYIKGNYPCDRLSDTKHLYSKMGQLRCPSWVGAFFGNDESYQEMFKTQTTSAVLMLMYGREAQDMDSQPCRYSEVRGTQ